MFRGLVERDPFSWSEKMDNCRDRKPFILQMLGSCRLNLLLDFIFVVVVKVYVSINVNSQVFWLDLSAFRLNGMEGKHKYNVV